MHNKGRSMGIKVCKSFFIQSLRITNIVITVLCLLSILTSCSKNEKIDPDEYIQSVYSEYEQLAKLENPTEQMILLKSQDSYELVQFKKKGNSFTYNGGHITNAPYGLKSIKAEGKLYIIVFIDNTVVKADRFPIQLTASDKDEYLILSCPDLLKQDKYMIKLYVMNVAYDEAKFIKFYDKKGTLIPEEHIPDL
jgi:hypothetical protein